MSDPTPPPPPPNWYPDPEVPGQQRYWDGAQWTEHRAPASQPAPTQSAAVPSKKSRVPLWVPIVAACAVLLLFVFMIIATIGYANRGQRADEAAQASSPSSEAESNSPSPKATPTPKPTQAAEIGTFKNPGPAGASIQSTGFDGTTYDTIVTSVNWTANQYIADANMFNDAAPAGMHYVVVTFQVTNTTADAAKAVLPGAAIYDVSLVDGVSGQSYPQASVVLPNDMSSQNEIYSGQVAAGEAAYLVSDSAQQLLFASGGVFIRLA